MPIQPATCYQVTCFRCGAAMTDDYTTFDASFIHFASCQEAIDALADGEFGWGLAGSDGEQPYCPACLQHFRAARTAQCAARLTADPMPF
ncbi:hypothetical protein [Nocardiopsis halophila]|uniref:hypothetical protein n=1 Tax=Nocardiopsis halophila TaxID=141692 RepID=UPI00037AA882|nr:hypothetical protein [Nocardiopsis halophila]